MRTHARLIAPSAVVVMIFASACSPARSVRQGARVQPTPEAALTPTATEALSVRDLPAPERQVIQRGSMKLEVERVVPARERVEAVVAAVGGQVERLTASSDHSADYQLRIPTARLDAAMDSIALIGAVKDRSLAVDDVTEQVVDVEARLQSLRATRDRLRQLLDRAASVPDVITVERELARVQAELESLQARLESLRGLAAMSELNVKLDRPVVLGPLAALFVGAGRLLGKLFVVRS
jgi:hypothetical protein